MLGTPEQIKDDEYKKQYQEWYNKNWSTVNKDKHKQYDDKPVVKGFY